MRALTVVPGVPGSGALTDLREPDPGEGSVLVATRSVGMCGTDRELLAGEHGAAPPGEDRLVLGHESIGEVLEAPSGSGLSEGDLVVGVARRPDPVPCSNCAVGEFDMCRSGRYTEHGIQGAHGFARERWRAEPDAVVTYHATPVPHLDCEPGRHYVLGAAALAAADHDWLVSLITRHVPLDDHAQALVPQDDDVRTVVVF